MSATNRGTERHPQDFYPTPAWVTEAILPHISLAGRVLEPCAGDGAIARVLMDNGCRPDCLDLYTKESPFDANDCDWYTANFLLWDTEDDCDLIITNPPYSIAEDIIAHALDLARPYNGTVAMLLRLGWLEASGKTEATKRRREILDAHKPDIYVLSRRPSFTGKGTDASAYAWFVWGPGRGGRWFLL